MLRRLLLCRQTRMHEAHRMMFVMMVVVVVMIVLMTRRRRRIGIPSYRNVRNVDLRRHDDGRRLWRGLNLLRATDRVAASFAAPSRPTDLTFPHRCTTVSRCRCCRGRCRDAR